MDTHKPAATRKSEFWYGVRATFPLVVGAIPFGIIFGAIAVTSGISPAGALGMSLFVFAGSAQFIAAGLFAAGTNTSIIILTTFVVNLRHALYSTTLGPFVKGLPQKWLIPLGFWLTDETFVVTAVRYQTPDDSPYKHYFYFGSALFMYTNWQVSTWIGVVAGQSIPDPISWGLDIAMVVTFIGMVVPMVKTTAIGLSVVTAGIAALIFHGIPNQLGLILAALLGIACGTYLELRQHATSQNLK